MALFNMGKHIKAEAKPKPLSRFINEFGAI